MTKSSNNHYISLKPDKKATHWDSTKFNEFQRCWCCGEMGADTLVMPGGKRRYVHLKHLLDAKIAGGEK